jgi:transposase
MPLSSLITQSERCWASTLSSARNRVKQTSRCTLSTEAIRTPTESQRVWCHGIHPVSSLCRGPVNRDIVYLWYWTRSVVVVAERSKSRRRPLPGHLPRNESVLGIGKECIARGGKMRQLGEDVTEKLEYVPGRFIMNRIARARMACSCCEKISQAGLPSRPIQRGRPGPGLLAHVLVSKYADHLPLYRQSQIFERDGIDLERSTLSDWAGDQRRSPTS